MTRNEKIAYEAERKRKAKIQDQGKEKITRSYNGINAQVLSDVE